MTSDSHLYPGFRFAGALASVDMQRRLQQDALATLPVRQLLSVGCGYGDELDVMLDGNVARDDSFRVFGIDLADVADEVRARPNVARLGDRFKFGRLGLLDVESIEGFGSFDVVQCGFVLHDIDPEDKELAIDKLARAVRPGGCLLISDIFLSDGDVPREIESIYDEFIAEAHDALRRGQLERDQYEALAGDGACPGLIRSRSDAMRGTRDHFEESSVLIDRARRAGLVLQQVLTNPRSGHLLVMVFTRPRNIRLGGRPTRGNDHVL